jgi:hypothetical protein
MGIWWRRWIWIKGIFVSLRNKWYRLTCLLSKYTRTKWRCRTEAQTDYWNGLTMVFHAQLPKHFWVDAFMTTVFLINRLPSSVLKMETPFFKLHGTHPDYNSLKVFGCRCLPYLRDYAKKKFTPKSYSCVFLGYSPMHKGYRCLLHLP